MNLVINNALFFDSDKRVVELLTTGERLGAISERIDGKFKVNVYKKVKDPQFELPVWAETTDGSIVESLDDSRAMLEQLMESDLGA